MNHTVLMYMYESQVLRIRILELIFRTHDNFNSPDQKKSKDVHFLKGMKYNVHIVLNKM